jgi:carbonic anhydrase
VTACNESPSVEWAYTGHGASEHWPSLSPDFATCANGRQQSPIDITAYQPASLAAISFSFVNYEATLHNDDRQVRAEYGLANSSMLDDTEFHLKSVHFHSPSEHLVDGQSFSAELHMVHADADGNLAVIGALFTLGAPSPTAQSILDDAPPIGNTTSALIPLASSLPTNLSYYRYNGSKTTPPCDEPVDWYVLRQPLTISQDQVDGLLLLSGGPNNRPVQPIGGRVISVGGERP